MTHDERVEAARYLGFEVYQLRYLAELYKEDPRLPVINRVLGPALRRSIDYALLTHLRVLLVFFYPAKRFSGDCDVKDLLPTFTSPQSSFSQQKAEAIKQHLNKWHSHFTETRWKHKTQQIGMEEYLECANHIDELAKTLENNLTGQVLEAFQKRLAGFAQRDKSADELLILLNTL